MTKKTLLNNIMIIEVLEIYFIFTYLLNKLSCFLSKYEGRSHWYGAH